MDLERRSAPLSAPRASQEAAQGPRMMYGRAITYDSLSEDLGGFREVFRPGSVKLREDLAVLEGHEPRHVLGRTSAGTARAWDDGRGVVFEVEAPDTQWARDLAVSMERGDIGQCSFAFRTIREDYYYDQARETVIREVREAEVCELSIVAMPAYPATKALVG